jgi:hypothetical protein
LNQPRLKQITVEYICNNGHANASTEAWIRAIGGGCSGHGEGEYCYCPHPEAVITSTCNVCAIECEFTF